MLFPIIFQLFFQIFIAYYCHTTFSGTKSWFHCNAHEDCPVLLKAYKDKNCQWWLVALDVDHSTVPKRRSRKNQALTDEVKNEILSHRGKGATPYDLYTDMIMKSVARYIAETSVAEPRPEGGMTGARTEWIEVTEYLKSLPCLNPHSDPIDSTRFPPLTFSAADAVGSADESSGSENLPSLVDGSDGESGTGSEETTIYGAVENAEDGQPAFHGCWPHLTYLKFANLNCS